MTDSVKPFDSSSPFEQLLKQIKPTPLTGLEEMLYQAGWAAALQAQAVKPDSLGTGRPAPRRSSLGFFSGAASGLIAASLLFAITASSGWWPNLARPENATPSEQLVNMPGSGAESGSTPAVEQPAPALIAVRQGPQRVAGFNLLDWFGTNTETLTQAIRPQYSTNLTTGTLGSNDFDRLLSISANLPASEPESMDQQQVEPGPRGEILRYRPGGNSLPGLRF